MNLFLDSSCMVSFFILDAYFKKAEYVMKNIANGEIHGIISVISLAELCGAVRRRTDETTAKRVKNDVVGLVEKGMVSIIPLTNWDASMASDLAISTGLRGADAVIVSAAKQAGCELLTFDEEIKKKAKSAVEFYDA